ncbi:hypothetical protein PFICI_02795 [Pestalotiopsis fici W106-1]|uniref:RNA-dependent RNA polymerase n=1 Tax=Pestalotiopsis fici (strain W106-1 / CGMCC3.15140) TaxID=1229662 RepID=W3XFG7_PESFW|nr:uncharacterized protein PFICI_02795 [Pestalotiopsis fici W106-1]ETS84770.1 hypothetical protein PFICI_02795 [Pestalotiopsis fici W106-1]
MSQFSDSKSDNRWPKPVPRPVPTQNPRSRPRSNNASHQRNHQSSSQVVRQDWKQQREVTVMLSRMPPTTTATDIFQSLETYGRVASITIPQARREERTRHAYVDFLPAPDNAFWSSGSITIRVGGGSRKVQINLEPPRRPRLIMSPTRPGLKYSEYSILNMLSLDFGFLSDEHVIDVMKTAQHPKFSPILIVNFRYKRIEIRFTCTIKDPRREDKSIVGIHEAVGKMEAQSQAVEFRADIQFLHLQKAFFVDTSPEHWCLVLPQNHPPKFWKRRSQISSSHQTDDNRWSALDTWVRTTEISYSDWTTQLPITACDPFQHIDMGKWTTYRLNFDKSELPTWLQMQSALKDFNIHFIPTDADTFTWQPGRNSNFREALDDPDDADTADPLALLFQTNKIQLSWEVRWQLEAAISQGIFIEQSITPEFLKKLAEKDNLQTEGGQSLQLTNGNTVRKRNMAVNWAKYALEYATEAGRPIYNPMSLFDDRSAMTHYTSNLLPEHCTWVRKVVVTPSRIYLASPVPETTNRVLRHYEIISDRFLRVQFTDERNEGKVHPLPNSDSSDALFSKVYRTLRNGIRIGDKHFHFLAFGNSQFREHGAYFFSPTPTISCDDIRDWMGDFSHINVVGKYASRLGQCFSTTRDPKALNVGSSVTHIPDIEANGWTFSDGVGKISSWMATEIAKKLKVYSNGRVPSAFQFRHGGSKGILVVWPQNFNEISIRPSQKKFTAQAKNLEIIRASRFSVATLNRQTIAILSCLGVPDEAFITLAKHQLSDYSTAMSDPEMALRLLKQFTDENGMTTTIAQMIEDGFMKTKEPFVMSLLQLWGAWSMKLLREKARIVVEHGAFVFGCIDETRTLRGQQKVNEANFAKDRSKLPQIFIQVPIPGHPNDFRVIEGLCIVGRNPSLHPGDLRVVEAVNTDHPDLKALRNVVVFPADGERDIASMCSGGDLDGDDYFVMWDQQLIPQEWNHPPMIHDAAEPKIVKQDITVKDICRFFVEYMKNDSLSTIALAHLVWSDRSMDGPKSPQCVELAQLHSNAVDYSKTGHPAQIPRTLRPQQWPHFMERNPDKSYHSRKILGKLYDLVAKADFSPDLEASFDGRILRRYNLSDDLLTRARGMKTQYDIAMHRIMTQREIKTEFEVWTAFVLSKNRFGSNYKIQEDMGPVITSLRDRFIQACLEQAGAEDAATQDRDHKILNEFVAAMYVVTWEEVQIAIQEWHDTRTIAGTVVPKRSQAQKPLISFPWLFERELGRMVIDCSIENMELAVLPPVPQIVDAENIKEAEQCIAASLKDGRLYHRGSEVFTSAVEDDISISNRSQSSSPSRIGRTSTSSPSISNEDTMATSSSEKATETEEIEEIEEIEVEVENDISTGMDALQKLALKFSDDDDDDE